jgi:hypothetical protein
LTRPRVPCTGKSDRGIGFDPYALRRPSGRHDPGSPVLLLHDRWRPVRGRGGARAAVGLRLEKRSDGSRTAAPFSFSGSARKRARTSMAEARTRPRKRGEGQWGMSYFEPLNPAERAKRDDDGLNVRARIESKYAKHGFHSIDKTDLRSRFRWRGLYTQRRQGISAAIIQWAATEEQKTAPGPWPTCPFWRPRPRSAPPGHARGRPRRGSRARPVLGKSANRRPRLRNPRPGAGRARSSSASRNTRSRARRSS